MFDPKRSEFKNSLLDGNTGKTIPVLWEIYYDNNGVCIRFSEKLNVYEIYVNDLFCASINNNEIGFRSIRSIIKGLNNGMPIESLINNADLKGVIKRKPSDVDRNK